MSKKEKDVELIPSNVPSGWKVKHDNKEGDAPTGPQAYPIVAFQEKSGPHLVVFKIPKNSPAKFNANDPMWVHKGTQSPTQSGFDPQIADWALFDDDKTLVLLDLNNEPGELYYRVKADGYTPVLDPIIKNGGGTFPPPPPPAYSVGEIGAAAVVLLLVFFAGFIVHKRFFA